MVELDAPQRSETAGSRSAEYEPESRRSIPRDASLKSFLRIYSSAFPFGYAGSDRKARLTAKETLSRTGGLWEGLSTSTCSKLYPLGPAPASSLHSPGSPVYRSSWPLMQVASRQPSDPRSYTGLQYVPRTGRGYWSGGSDVPSRETSDNGHGRAVCKGVVRPLGPCSGYRQRKRKRIQPSSMAYSSGARTNQ